MIYHTRSKVVSSTSNNGSQPSKTEIARERTLSSISGKNKTSGNCDATNISMHDRIQQYPGKEDFVDEKCK